jgi:DNA-binding FadR family transcriptional regulator
MKEMVEYERTMLDNPHERERHNRSFHQVIYRSAHNRYLLSSLKALQTPMVLLGPATASDPARLKTASEEHAQLVDCIARHDIAGAQAVITQHLAGGQKAHISSMLRNQNISR